MPWPAAPKGPLLRDYCFKWLLAGAAAVFAYGFLFPSHASSGFVPSGSGSAPTVSSDATEHVYVSIAVPMSGDDAEIYNGVTCLETIK